MQRKLKCFSFLLLVNSLTYAQETQKPPTSTQQVIINGGQTDIEKNREFVAGKLIISKKTIAESGLQNVDEILRREPAITIGKDGRIGLMSLPGYTQVLVDGMPPSGKDPFELDLVHVERIEIIKSATAATGPFGIAGTINIIRRKIDPTRFSQLNAGVSSIAGQYGANLSWLNNQASGNAPLSFNLSLSANRTDKPGYDSYQTTQAMSGLPLQAMLQGIRTSASTTEYVLGAGEFAWKLGSGQNLKFSPDLGQVTVAQRGNEQRLWVDGRKFTAQENGKDTMSSYSFPLQWSWLTESDSRIELKLSMNHITTSSSNTNLQLSENGPQIFSNLRNKGRRAENSNQFLNLNYKTEFQGGHDFEAGTSITHNTGDTTYEDFINGSRDTTLSALGYANATNKYSYRLFMQDDWRMNKSLAFNFGISTEQQDIRLDEGPTHNTANFRMWAPSIHVVKKIAGDSKRQLRASLARTFQAPTTNQLLLHPRINSLAACDANTLCTANTPDTADSAGNPNLQPESALGLNLSYTHGISENSELAVDYYMRNISHKIGSEMSLENLAWASVPRYVIRPANLGEAKIQGINLTARLTVRDFWKDAPKLDVSGNVGFAHSELSNIPGPDNRLAGQTPWLAKLSASYTASDWPLRLNLDANWLPGDWVRNNLTQRTYQSRMFTVNSSASWKVNSDLRLSLNLENLFPTDRKRIDEYLNTGGLLQQTTQSAAYRRIGLRLEMKM
ncbi:TonB-dependent receptor [Undibacterium sp. CY18W]|uniref:TonB-dependent receptor n=1 Tax=Undibacterium hunanense TaxID=2762292 RepID=A0ABR6ZLI2_9BURK|nr:TonB-dependent receptor [Undibacterium hunanense]MBC3916742.1 TonB-dependent receptor [Undibacterium hunanense]